MDAKHDPGPESHAPPHRGRREYLELWISLARREWGSLVLVPADRDGSTAEIANALADIGQRLSYEPVTAITVSSLEYGSALALADLQQHLGRERRVRRDQEVVSTSEDMAGNGSPSAAGAPERTPAGGGNAPAGRAPAAAEGPRGGPEQASTPSEALAVVPPTRLIISVPPVIAEPLGLTAVHRADAVVLAVRMNRSRMGEVRRSVELIGRERLFGCFILR